MAAILAALSIKKAKGLGNPAVFALVTLAMRGYLYSLKRPKAILQENSD